MTGGAREVLIAVEGIDASAVTFGARLAATALESAGVLTDLVSLHGADTGTPLRERSAAGRPRVIRLMLHRRAVVAAPYTGTILAYRQAAGGLTEDDLAVAGRWREQGQEPDLTLLMDTDPAEIAGRYERGHAAAARDALLRTAGQHRETWRVVSGYRRGGPRYGPVIDEIGQQVRWLLHTRTARWPLDGHGWRRLRPAGV